MSNLKPYKNTLFKFSNNYSQQKYSQKLRNLPGTSSPTKGTNVNQIKKRTRKLLFGFWWTCVLVLTDHDNVVGKTNFGSKDWLWMSIFTFIVSKGFDTIFSQLTATLIKWIKVDWSVQIQGKSHFKNFSSPLFTFSATFNKSHVPTTGNFHVVFTSDTSEERYLNFHDSK